MATIAAIPLGEPDQFSGAHDDAEQGGLQRGVPIRSISRAVTVLREINRHGELSVTEIAQQAGVPYPTASRIVQTLVHEGLIARANGSKRYRPTAKIVALSNGYDINASLAEIALPFMERCTLKQGWPLSLTTHVGNSMILRASTHALTSLTFNNYQPGYAVPILESAAGLIYLAHCRAEVRTAITEQLRRFGDEDTQAMVQLAMEGGLLKTVRQSGYAARSFNRFTRNPGRTSSIAVPILKDGTVHGALGMAFFSATIEISDAVKDLLPELRHCAEEITRAL